MLAPDVVISCFYAPIKSPICFNKSEHRRDERADRRVQLRLLVAPSVSLPPLSIFLSLTLLISRDFGPSLLDAPRTNEDGMNAITSRHCRLFCARYYLSVFAHVVIVVGRFLPLPLPSSPLPPFSLLCLLVSFYLGRRLFRRCPPTLSIWR